MNVIYKVLIALLSISALAANGQTSEQDSLRKAEACYTAQDYTCSAALYQSVADAGYASPVLYFNLANSYFKLGSIAYAILYYEKALVLSPADEEIRDNLTIARSHQVDKIEVLPEFALRTWFKSIAALLSSDAWAYTAVGLFTLFLGALALYVFSSSVEFRKSGFFAAFAFIILFSASAYMSSWRKSDILRSGAAIIITPTVTIKSAPDSSGTDLMVVHEGMKVHTFKSVGDWTEVKLPDGSVGWMLSADFLAI